MSEDADSGDSRRGQTIEIYDEWREQFLGGHLSEEEERHCFNVGRVALEFARLEEEIGRLVFDLDEDRRDTGTEYMQYIKYSGKIAGHLRRAAKAHPSLRVDLDDVANRYIGFASRRNRYAHASVGTFATVDAETGALEIKSMQEKHARSETVANVPTDDEIMALCKEMRRASLELIEARFARSTERSARAITEAFKATASKLEMRARRFVERFAQAVEPHVDRINTRVQEAVVRHLDRDR